MDIPHELRDEFPQEISLIERMIRTNYEFRRLAERYDEVNRNIYRIESGEEPTTDEVLARLKKWRLKLKDEIAAILTKLEHRMQDLRGLLYFRQMLCRYGIFLCDSSVSATMLGSTARKMKRLFTESPFRFRCSRAD